MNRKDLITACSAVVLSTSAWAQDPQQMPDDSWISISGTVESVSPNAFTLDYGDATVIVEMDDAARDADAYKLVKGDRVTVDGVIDDDFFEATSIEASSVFVENIGTYFFANPVDDETTRVQRTFAPVTYPIIEGATSIQGTITGIDREDETFQLSTGTRLVTVAVGEMTNNPLDDEGYQQLQTGDEVVATGTLDDRFFEGRVFIADYVTTMANRQ